MEIVVLCVDGLDFNTDLGPLGKERRRELTELRFSHVGSPPRSHVEGERSSQVLNAEVFIVCVVDGVLDETIKVGAEGRPELVVGDVCPSREGKGHGGDVDLGEHLDDGRGDDAIGRATTAAKGPEEIRVLGLAGSQEAAIGSDDFERKHAVGGHAPQTGHGAVTAAQDVAANDTDSLALASNGSDAILVCGFIHLERPDAGAELEGGTTVRVLLVALQVLDVVELMGPDGQGASAGGFCAEVVASVLHDEAKVEIAGEVDGQLDVGDLSGLDDIRGKAANLAVSLADIDRGRHAAQALEEDGIDGRGILRMNVRAIDPVGGQEVALGLVKVAEVVVADRGFRNGLGKSTAQEEVKDVPDQVGGVQEVSGVCLASAEE
ncbi:hypothetical protein CGRA01v4_03331 [Colletotrichum graminicola]|nr:hypothetical protein CGRA01v4_03331 [Colletotrichum graminicola]